MKTIQYIWPECVHAHAHAGCVRELGALFVSLLPTEV